ncbi:hypothetical protein MRX96_022914 [Rhipicephalus microplus]
MATRVNSLSSQYELRAILAGFGRRKRGNKNEFKTKDEQREGNRGAGCNVELRKRAVCPDGGGGPGATRSTVRIQYPFWGWERLHCLTPSLGVRRSFATEYLGARVRPEEAEGDGDALLNCAAPGKRTRDPHR